MGQRGAWAAKARNAGDRAYHFLLTERVVRTTYGVVIAATLLFVFFVLGWQYISGTGVYWQHPPYDAGAHVSGWLLFKADTWRFPIFDTVRMDYPDGGSIILTDSIPLMAFVAKLLGLGLLGSWHYFGLFVAVSYVLNAVALLWLLRQMGLKNAIAPLVAVTFACFTTLYDIQFESFFAQFIVILSLGFYVRLRRRFATNELGLFAALVVASLLIHPYLFAMSLGVFVVTLMTLWRRGRLSLRFSLVWLGATLLSIGLLGWVSGYLSHQATGYQEWLYGASPMFALDPAALFQKKYSVDEIGTYLGAGFWLLALAGLAVAWRHRAMLLKSHIWLVILCIAFLVLALSNTLFVNGHMLFHVSLPGPVASIAEMFRASKRFVMPVYYGVIAAAVALLARNRSRWAIAIILGALVLQVTDASYFVRDLHDSTHQGQPVILDEYMWTKSMNAADIVQVFPSYSCLFDYRSTPLSNQWTASLEFYQLAAKEGKISNSIRASRRTKDCTSEAQQAHSNPPQGNLYIYLADDNKRLIIKPSRGCIAQQHSFAYGIYCTSQ